MTIMQEVDDETLLQSAKRKRELLGKQRAATDNNTYYQDDDYEQDDEEGIPNKRHSHNAEDEDEEQRLKEIEEYVESNMSAAARGNFEDENDLDDKAVKRLVLKLERAISRNQEFRIKYADTPEKFEESELELAVVLKELQVLTVDTKWLQLLIELNVISSLLGLLAHENTEIVIKTLELINELVDEDNYPGDEEEDEEEEDEEEDERKEENALEVTKQNERNIRAFNEELIEQGFAPILLDVMKRLDENSSFDEKQAVFICMSIVESLTSLEDPEKADVTKSLVNGTELVKWLIDRVSRNVKDLGDSNKLYALELLSIFLQRDESSLQPTEDDQNIKKTALANQFIGILLRQLAQFRKRDPEDAQETELMENAFNALCSLILTDKEAKQVFQEEEGFELMSLMLQEKKMARVSAIKVIDNALSTETGRSNAFYFVEKLGLGHIFSCFLKKDVKRLKKYKNFVESEDDEHVLSILVALFRCFSSPPLKGKEEGGGEKNGSNFHSRLVSKFAEKEGEKIQQLGILFNQYLKRMEKTESDLEQEMKVILDQLDSESEEGDQEETLKQVIEEFYLRKLDAGLFILQLLALIICYLIDSRDSNVVTLINDQLFGEESAAAANDGETSISIDVEAVKAVLEEYLEHIGDGEFMKREKQLVTSSIKLLTP